MGRRGEDLESAPALPACQTRERAHDAGAPDVCALDRGIGRQLCTPQLCLMITSPCRAGAVTGMAIFEGEARPALGAWGSGRQISIVRDGSAACGVRGINWPCPPRPLVVAARVTAQRSGCLGCVC